MSRMGVTIENAEDLAKQTKIKYGGVQGGSTLNFFKDSNFSIYNRMWSAMESMEPSPFMADNNEGEINFDSVHSHLSCGIYISMTYSSIPNKKESIVY